MMRMMHSLVLVSVLSAAVCGSAAATGFTKSCALQAPGDACILGFVAGRAGQVGVCTRAGRADERWRATVVRKLERGGSADSGT